MTEVTFDSFGKKDASESDNFASMPQGNRHGSPLSYYEVSPASYLHRGNGSDQFVIANLFLAYERGRR